VKHIHNSPINNSELQTFLSCKDHTVSKEDFTLLRDIENDLLVTSPRPEKEELQRYYASESYISHTDSKSSLLDKLYHFVRNHTLRQKLKLINSFNSKEKTILDIGAGTGDFLSICARNGWKIEGVEPSEKAKSTAEEKLGRSLKYEISEIKQEKFDVITMWHVLEHVPNLNETIANLKRILNPDGTLVIAVPNFKSFDAAHYGKFWAAFDVPRHLWHFSQTAMKKFVTKEGLILKKTIPMKFDAYYVSLLSEKYKTGSLRPVKAFLTGMRSNLKAKRTKEYSSLIYIIKKA